MIKYFRTKKEILNYIVNNFSRKNYLVIIRGSTARKEIKLFSDIDIEIYGKKKLPYYEIISYNDRPVLLSICFNEYKKGNKCKPPKKIKVIQGDYNDKIDEIFNEEFGKKDKYNRKQFSARNCQLVFDFFFKYMRSGNKRWLDLVNNKMRIK